MVLRIYFFALIIVSVFLTACSTGFHGSFVEHTFIDPKTKANANELGNVQAESCQTKALYVFPMGLQPSTDQAIRLAKEQFKNTAFLTDVSIDDKVYWKIGYLKQCITVTATAFSGN